VRLAALSVVRNECDIIEAFVRHTTALVDRLYVIDHGSGDATPEILGRLKAEGLPVRTAHIPTGRFYQGRITTTYMKLVTGEDNWDFIFLLDADELLDVNSRTDLEHALSTLRHGQIGMLAADQFAPAEGDNSAESDPIRRITHRVCVETGLQPILGKVSVPGDIARSAGFRVGEGNHFVSVDNQDLVRSFLPIRIAHFPVRSIDQFITKVVVSRLAWLSRRDYVSGLCWHFTDFYDRIKRNPTVSIGDLTNAALTYADVDRNTNPPSWVGAHQTFSKHLTLDPFSPAYDRVKYTDLMQISVLPRIMEAAESLALERTHPAL
jgi:hypothetical protein